MYTWVWRFRNFTSYIENTTYFIKKRPGIKLKPSFKTFQSFQNKRLSEKHLVEKLYDIKE